MEFTQVCQYAYRYSYIKVYTRDIRGHAMTQLVEVLRYKSEGREFYFRWCYWIFSLTSSFRPHCGPGVDSASNRNEYQACFLEVKVAGA
jgi:hypothetical protein